MVAVAVGVTSLGCEYLQLLAAGLELVEYWPTGYAAELRPELSVVQVQLSAACLVRIELSKSDVVKSGLVVLWYRCLADQRQEQLVHVGLKV